MRRLCRICRRWVPAEHVVIVLYHAKLSPRGLGAPRYPVCAKTVETVLGWPPCKEGPSDRLDTLDIVNIAASRRKNSPDARS
jgi:hypothetical protein